MENTPLPQKLLSPSDFQPLESIFQSLQMPEIPRVDRVGFEKGVALTQMVNTFLRRTTHEIYDPQEYKIGSRFLNEVALRTQFAQEDFSRKEDPYDLCCTRRITLTPVRYQTPLRNEVASNSSPIPTMVAGGRRLNVLAEYLNSSGNHIYWTWDAWGTLRWNQSTTGPALIEVATSVTAEQRPTPYNWGTLFSERAATEELDKLRSEDNQRLWLSTSSEGSFLFSRLLIDTLNAAMLTTHQVNRKNIKVEVLGSTSTWNTPQDFKVTLSEGDVYISRYALQMDYFVCLGIQKASK